jgi:RNA polymerase sigma-70 factor (ECF subfamily)
MEMSREYVQQEIDTNALLERAAEGDQASFRQLYDALAPRILAFLMHMLADRHLAEDVLQETMIQSWRKASDFDADKSKASTWITAIARNRAIDLLRKTGRFRQVIEDSDYQIGEALYPNSSATDSIESSQTSGRLAHCLDELGEDTVACIRLAYINGFSFSEIAVVRQDSVNTIKSWIRRGLEKLGRCMQR